MTAGPFSRRRFILQGAGIACGPVLNATSVLAAGTPSPLERPLAEARVPMKAVAVCNPFGYPSRHATDDRYAQNPYRSGWPSWSEAMPVFLKEALREAGFDGLRLAICPGPLLEAQQNRDEPRLDLLIEMILAACDDIVRDGFRCILDMHMDGYYPPAAYTSVNLVDGPTGPNFNLVVEMERRIAAVIAGRYAPSEICLEVFNEAPPSVGRADWEAQITQLYRAVRAEMPRHPIMISGINYASSEGLTLLDPKVFDDLTLFTFHCYEVPVFTHQGSDNGVVKYFSRLPFPPTGTRAEADYSVGGRARAAVQADYMGGRIRADQRDAYLDTIRYYLDEIYGTPRDGTWLRRYAYEPVAAWADRCGVARYRINLGEFGVWGDMMGRRNADVTSKANYLRAARQGAESLGFGWCVWELENPATGWRIVDGQRRLVPAYTAALFD